MRQALAVLLALFFVEQAWAEPAEDMEDMLERRIDWITEHYPDLEYDGEELPEVQSVPYENLIAMLGVPPGRDVQAIHDHRMNVIFLRDDFGAADLDVAYIIVHELVHYLQGLREPVAEGECLADRELEAYEVQEQWQREFGPWPRDWDWLFVMKISQCEKQW